MRARFIDINPDNPQPRLIKQVAAELRKGGVICYPTDTVYGIGCDIFHQKAIKRICQIKKWPKHKPFSFMCSDLSDLSKYCHVSNTAYRLMKKNLPGPYTFILPASKLVPKIMTTKQKTVGIRVPANDICRALVAELGNPIVTSSAVAADGDKPMSEAYEIEDLLGNQVDTIIGGGTVYPTPSTIISMINDDLEILRQGKGETSHML